MPESRRRAAAHDSSQPIKIRRPERQAGHQQIRVSKRADPVIHALGKRVSGDHLLVMGSTGARNGVSCHGRLPSSSALISRYTLAERVNHWIGALTYTYL